MQYYILNLYYLINKSILYFLNKCNKTENPITASQTTNTRKKRTTEVLKNTIKIKVLINLITSIITKQAKKRLIKNKKINKNKINKLNISR